jgi:hypothetical protein
MTGQLNYSIGITMSRKDNPSAIPSSMITAITGYAKGQRGTSVTGKPLQREDGEQYKDRLIVSYAPEWPAVDAQVMLMQYLTLANAVTLTHDLKQDYIDSSWLNGRIVNTGDVALTATVTGSTLIGQHYCRAEGLGVNIILADTIEIRDANGRAFNADHICFGFTAKESGYTLTIDNGTEPGDLCVIITRKSAQSCLLPVVRLYTFQPDDYGDEIKAVIEEEAEELAFFIREKRDGSDVESALVGALKELPEEILTKLRGKSFLVNFHDAEVDVYRRLPQ